MGKIVTTWNEETVEDAQGKKKRLKILAGKLWRWWQSQWMIDCFCVIDAERWKDIPDGYPLTL